MARRICSLSSTPWARAPLSMDGTQNFSSSSHGALLPQEPGAAAPIFLAVPCSFFVQSAPLFHMAEHSSLSTDSSSSAPSSLRPAFLSTAQQHPFPWLRPPIRSHSCSWLRPPFRLPLPLSKTLAAPKWRLDFFQSSPWPSSSSARPPPSFSPCAAARSPCSRPWRPTSLRSGVDPK
uniref:Uncharacterized protein n=1 Tax=Zea mays TaxID=4577 RepID=B4FNS1_MAIZE|nr:unknown [Zea mays]